MKREQQKTKHQNVIDMYTTGATAKEIGNLFGYTQTNVYTILKNNNVPTRKDITDSKDDPDTAFLMPSYKSRKLAIKAIERADFLEAKPHLILDDAEYSRLNITPRRRAACTKVLNTLSLCFMPTPYPALFDLDGNRYFRLSHREMLFLFADPIRFLTEYAGVIKKGWKKQLTAAFN